MRRNILLIEDQPAVRDVMLELIDEAGVHADVRCAGSLGQARELLSTGRWDCMVADLTLGDGQSLELVAELRARDDRMPVVLVSGFLSTDRLREARRLGVDHVLHKPFHPNALLEIMRDIFGVREAVPAVDGGADVVACSDALLPELFRMDRRLGLMFRMVNEIPRHADVSGICNSALALAMDMIQAGRGFIALFDRTTEKLFMMAHRIGDAGGPVCSDCRLNETPFAALLNGEIEVMRQEDCEDAPACWPGVPVAGYVAVPVRLQGRATGVVCLMDCRDQAAFEEQQQQMLGLLVSQLDTLLDNCAVHAALENSMRETLIALVRSLEARDRYTKDHSARVSKISTRLARRLGLDDSMISLVRTGGLLHDIGKVGIQDTVLLKPGRFSAAEYEIIKSHPVIGDAILRHMDTLGPEREIVRHHHERMDGGGYPDGLKGEAIPLPSRIVCVADSIDAMTTHRVYRMAQPVSFCIEQLKKNSGTQFDAMVAEVAIAAIEAGEICSQASSGRGGAGNNVRPVFLPASAKT